MTGSRLMMALTILNVGVLLLGIAQHGGPSFAQSPEPPPVLRARAFELVDGQGRVRGTLAVLPASTTSSLKLRAENGREQVPQP